MGWKELRAWIRVMNRQLEGPQPDPGTWSQASRDNFADLDKKRQALRGR